MLLFIKKKRHPNVFLVENRYANKIDSTQSFCGLSFFCSLAPGSKCLNLSCGLRPKAPPCSDSQSTLSEVLFGQWMFIDYAQTTACTL